MKIAYVTTYDVLNTSGWTKHNLGNYGSNHYILKTLSAQGIHIESVGDCQKRYGLLTKGKWSFYRYFDKQDYYRWAEPIVCKDYASQIAKKLSRIDVDLILCTEGFTPIAYLNYQQPIVLWLDTVLAALIDFYPYLSNLCPETKKNIYLLEKLALDKCKLAIFASEWAAQKAVEIYGINPNKIKIISRGSNLELEPERTIADIISLIKSRGNNTCKLIFIGVDWQRKGGSIALEVSKELDRMGLDVELKILGDLPKNRESLPSFVKPVGYINKSTTEGKKQYYDLLADAHFLILPTQADVTPNVLIEANAFGVPCLTTKVAGIPSIIKDDVNGKTFAVDADVQDYTTYIKNYLADDQKYKNLALSSFNEYVTRLNWSIAGQTANQLFQELISSKKTSI
ncbi:glycosyltransferase family 4 protein [Calothrix sp. PCC 7507]|uniref:glycosyltransferase family 4 protein n=1 Tax=Calothrix sp. PCC 7507 TaxID=99598 RepID=UPI00029F2000|nr:glycosyltransferase family 4 protein [Calothrix sp. PCC 7507]AFY32578.1 glycosyl transferase group 1 [Calothrix sp. PCC 7507]